tara:strand:- start:1828 stop:1986 length:159 start_codon:yes stop_codon:yes gene_type:complete
MPLVVALVVALVMPLVVALVVALVMPLGIVAPHATCYCGVLFFQTNLSTKQI